jgi:Uma2 family endonuclease
MLRTSPDPGGEALQESKKMTTAEYLQTPETVLPRELAYGELRVAEAPAVPHQRMVGRLFLALAPLVRERRLGEILLSPTDVILDYDAALVVQPDLTFVSRERADRVTARVEGAPDLVIEVLSPHPRIGRLEERVGWFARAGVRECWLVSLPERRVAVLTMDGGVVSDRRTYVAGETVMSQVVSAFVLPLDLFADFA